MSINRFARRVDENQTQVIAALRAAGFRVEILGKPVDLLVEAMGRFALVEVKDGNKVPSAQGKTTAQEKFFQEYKDCALFLINSPQNAVETLNEWRLK